MSAPGAGSLVVVTGADRGIGLEVVRVLAATDRLADVAGEDVVAGADVCTEAAGTSSVPPLSAAGSRA